jgi:antitoxin ParD1/3/4
MLRHAGKPMNMNVSLPEDLAAYVESKVSTGHYGSSSEVVCEALRLMAKVEEDGGEITRLRAAWNAGKASGPAGEVDFDGLRHEGRTRLTTAQEAIGRAG